MKFVKNCLLSSLLFFSQYGLSNPPQEPFSPCKTDAQTVQIRLTNNWKDAACVLCDIAQTDMPVVKTLPTPTAEQNNTPKKDNTAAIAQLSDITKADIKIKVNGNSLKQGHTMTLNIHNNEPLMISFIGDSWTLIQYLIDNNLLNNCTNVEVLNRFQKYTDQHPWQTDIVEGFADCFSSPTKGTNKTIAKMIAYAKTYRNTVGFFGGTLTLEIPIDAKQLKNEIITDIDDPTVDFYDILDIVINRLNEPEHIKYVGGLINPVIQIA